MQLYSDLLLYLLTNLNNIKLIFDNKQTTDTGIFNLENSIEKFTFVNVIYSFGGSKNAVDSIKSTIFPVALLKQKYNCIFNLSAPYVKSNNSILVRSL